MRLNKLFLLATFPIVGLSSSCAYGKKLQEVDYTQAKTFAAEHFDEHALDTVPATFQHDVNTFQAKVKLSYETPSGGEEEVNISFGFNGIHITARDMYAYVVSSQVIDEVERYNSMAASLVSSFLNVDTVPVELKYLVDSSKMTFELGIAPSQTGNFLIHVLSLLTGSLANNNAMFGYADLEKIDEGGSNLTPYESIIKLLLKMIKSSSSDKNEVKPTNNSLNAFNRKKGSTKYIDYLLNYVMVTINTSSYSKGDAFDVLVNTDENGYLDSMSAKASSTFNISGSFAVNEYENDIPVSGEKPISQGYQYRFTLEGTYDIDISSNTIYENAQ